MQTNHISSENESGPHFNLIWFTITCVARLLLCWNNERKGIRTFKDSVWKYQLYKHFWNAGGIKKMVRRLRDHWKLNMWCLLWKRATFDLKPEWTPLILWYMVWIISPDWFRTGVHKWNSTHAGFGLIFTKTQYRILGKNSKFRSELVFLSSHHWGLNWTQCSKPS